MASEAVAIERRRNRRFPISLKLRYLLSRSVNGEGQVCDMSSSGLLFQSRELLPIGGSIEVILAWPFLLNGDCPLQLRIEGRVLRSDRRGTAVRIRNYEFRTSSKGAARVTALVLGKGA
jgi:PilZ domain